MRIEASDDASWIAPDGVRYRVRRWGNGPPLVMLHGFTGGASGWCGLARDLGSRWRVIAPDLLGHGESSAPADPARYSTERQVSDLAGLLAEQAHGPVALLGYSMGARLSLAFAAAHPARVARLVLESGTAGIEDQGLRAARRMADDALADRIERGGIAAFVAEWERLPMWESQSALPDAVRQRQRQQRLNNQPAGLANALRGFGQGVQPALWGALPRLPMPVLALAGALDGPYAARAERIGAAVPKGTIVVVPGAGHAPHLECPDEFRVVVERFLLDCGPDAAPNRGDR